METIESNTEHIFKDDTFEDDIFEDNIPAEDLYAIEKGTLDYIYCKLTYENFIDVIDTYDIIELFTTYLVGNVNKFVSPKRRKEINNIMNILEQRSKNISGRTIANILRSYIKIYEYDVNVVLRCIEKSNLSYYDSNNENLLYIALENLNQNIMDINKINFIIKKIFYKNEINRVSFKYPRNTITILLFKILRTVPLSNEIVSLFIENNFTLKLTDSYGRTALDYCILNYFTREYYDKNIILNMINYTMNDEDYIDNFYGENERVTKRAQLRISKENIPNLLLTTYGMNDRYDDDLEIISNVIYTLPTMNKPVYHITLIGSALQGNIFTDQLGIDLKKKYYFNNIIKYILNNTSDDTINKNYDNVVEPKHFNFYYEKPQKYFYQCPCQYDLGDYVKGNYDLEIIKELLNRTYDFKIDAFMTIFESVQFDKTSDYELLDFLLSNINISELKSNYEHQLNLICYLNMNAIDYDDFLFNKENHKQHERRIHYLLSRSLITSESISSTEYFSDDIVFEPDDMESSRLYLINCFKKHFNSKYLLLKIMNLYKYNIGDYIDITENESTYKFVLDVFDFYNNNRRISEEIKDQITIFDDDNEIDNETINNTHYLDADETEMINAIANYFDSDSDGTVILNYNADYFDSDESDDDNIYQYHIHVENVD